MSDDECDESGSLKKRRVDEEEDLSGDKPKLVAYNRCRKLVSNTQKCSAKNLRKVSEHKINVYNSRYPIYPKLTPSDCFCSKCRQLLYDVCVSSQESSSQGMSRYL